MNYALIREFYNNLQDAESRFIFESRIGYLFTGDRRYIRNMVEETNRLFHPAKFIRNVDHHIAHMKLGTHPEVIIYGAGTKSKTCLEKLRSLGITVMAFCDKKFENGGGAFGVADRFITRIKAYSKISDMPHNYFEHKIRSGNFYGIDCERIFQ